MWRGGAPCFGAVCDHAVNHIPRWYQDSPVFSPVADQSRSARGGKGRQTRDIYVKLVEDGTPLRLTTPQAPTSPRCGSPTGVTSRLRREIQRTPATLLPALTGTGADGQIADDSWGPPTQISRRNID